MAVAFPDCKWPASLEEQGPPEDPSILLTGTAYIGDAVIKIIAIRVNLLRRATPDYRPDVPIAGYRDGGYATALDTILDEFEDVAAQLGEFFGEEHTNIVELPTGSYQIWGVPVSFG
jgi:hypothetical protein